MVGLQTSKTGLLGASASPDSPQCPTVSSCHLLNGWNASGDAEETNLGVHCRSLAEALLFSCAVPASPLSCLCWPIWSWCQGYFPWWQCLIKQLLPPPHPIPHSQSHMRLLVVLEVQFLGLLSQADGGTNWSFELPPSLMVFHVCQHKCRRCIPKGSALLVSRTSDRFHWRKLSECKATVSLYWFIIQMKFLRGQRVSTALNLE